MVKRDWQSIKQSSCQLTSTRARDINIRLFFSFFSRGFFIPIWRPGKEKWHWFNFPSYYSLFFVGWIACLPCSRADRMLAHAELRPFNSVTCKKSIHMNWRICYVVWVSYFPCHLFRVIGLQYESFTLVVGAPSESVVGHESGSWPR